MPEEETNPRAWTKPYRRYLALRQNEDLAASLAIAPAEVAEFLKLSHRRDAEATNERIGGLRDQFASAREEALTIELAYFDVFAGRCETFQNYPIHRQNGALDTGIWACEQAIQAAEKLEDLPCAAFYAATMGTGFSGAGLLERASTAYRAALGITRDLAATRSELYLPQVAMVLNNLGNVLLRSGELEGARADFTEALESYRRLAQLRPSVYRPRVAAVLNNLATVLGGLEDLDQARASLAEALEICRELAQSEPDIYRPKVAMLLNNIGAVFRRLRELEDSRTSCSEALEIYRDLAHTQPEPYRADMAMTAGNLGDVFRDLSDLNGALACFKWVLGIYRDLAQTWPDVYRPDLAVTLTRLGNVLHDLRKPDQARVSLTEALELYRELAKTRSDVYLRDVAATLNNLGNVFRDLREPEAARASCSEALEILRELAQKSPYAHRPELATTLNTLGSILLALKDTDEARNYFEASLNLFLEPATEPSSPEEKSPPVEKNNRMWIDASLPCANLCRLARDQGRVDEARRLAEQALEHLERGLGQLRISDHNDKFKASVEDVALILVEQYSSEPPSRKTSSKLLRLFEWLRRAEATAELNRGNPALAMRTATSHPILWIQLIHNRLIFGLLLPGDELRILKSEEIEYLPWRRKLETALRAVAEGDADKITRTAGRLFSSFPEEVRNIFLEPDPDPVFVSPCGETLALPLELIPAPDGDSGWPFAGLRRLAIRFHGLAELDMIVNKPPCLEGAPSVVVGNPDADTDRALNYAEEGARHVAGLLNTTVTIGPKATRPSVLSAISNRALGTFVFAGHGARGGLLLAGGQRIWFTDLTAINWENTPFIHLDCCDAGAVAGAGGGRFLGMPSVMLGCGAGAVLASFHPLDDKRAMWFSNSFYNAMIRHELPLGEALMTARHQSQNRPENSGSPSFWATSVLWGNPQIHLKASP